MRLVVIGGNAAGMSAAARARRLDRSLEIVVLEKSPHVAWGACGLPYFVEGQVASLEALSVYSAEHFRRERNIGVRTAAEVAAIQHSRRQVALAGGERIGYDKLVIATGARPDTSGIDGAERAFTLASRADAERLRSALPGERRGVIAGAGYLGLELAGMLRAHGLEVTILEACGDVFSRGDERLTEFVCAHLKLCGVQLRLGQRLTSVAPGAITILATGFRPNVELAADAGVEIGRTGAVRTTDRMETNLTGVYAAGDCAEATHLVTARPVYIPLGTTANKMGRVAGANAAGRRERFPGVAGTTIARVCGLGVAVTGLSEVQARREGFDPAAATIEARDRAAYFRGANATVQLVADRRTRRVIGGWVAGEHDVAGRINVVAAAVAAGMRVEDFEQLDLAYAPPYAPVWDPLLIAAQQLIKAL